MKYTNLQLAEFALKVLAMDTRYWYGTFGVKATSSLYASKKAQYPGHYTKARAAQYQKDIAAGKWVTDCMGLIKWFFWSQNFGRDTKYADGYPDISADQCIQGYCSKTGSIGTIPDVPGLVIWSKGHIGVTIGGGWAVEARGFAYGVVKTRIKDRSWTKWGRLKALDYVDGAVDVGGEPAPAPQELGERLLEKGCVGEDVRKLQAALIALGFGKHLGEYGTDGEYGTMTDTAVRAFQKAYGLTVDGQFGPKSLDKLRALLDIATWTEPVNTDPLTEDDLPPETPDTEDDAPDSDEQVDGDAAMGAGSVNPYPIPTQIKRQGSKGQTVRWVQWELQQSGFWAVKVDGKTQNLVVDGEVGPKTRAALLAEWDVCEHGDAEGAPAPVPPDASGLAMAEEQPDISYYDGKPDFSKVTVKHLWIREGDSLRKRDPEFVRNVREATKHGILWSSYLFFRAGTAADARAEVQAFVQRIQATGETPMSVVLDVEVASCTPAAVKAAHAELRRLLGQNMQIGLYIGHHLCVKFKAVIPLFDYQWVPRYNGWKTPPAYTYQIWQGAFGKFAGIRGGAKKVDCNRLKAGWTWERLFARRAAEKAA